MAEQNKDEPTGQEPIVNEPKQLSDVELRAQEQGWVPQEEWTGDAEQWRPAKEFLDRGELFKKIDEQNRTIKEFRKTLDEFAKHHSRVKDTEYKRALDDLKKAKKDALVEGDADAVIDIDEKIAMVREAQQTEAAPKVPDVPQGNPVFDNWIERNSWYKTNRAMKAVADDIGKQLAAEGHSPTEILAIVEREVKKEFADKFVNPNRNKPGAVEGSTNKGSKGTKETFTLTDEERRVANKFIRSIPGYTMEKYVEELKRVKGV
jgi:Zn-finger nucleic acid-binding protein